MILPVSHVVQKAIEQAMKTIKQGLQTLLSGKGPESRTIDYSVISLHV